MSLSLAGTRSMQDESSCRRLMAPTEDEAKRPSQGGRGKGRKQTLGCRNTNEQMKLHDDRAEPQSIGTAKFSGI
jgi:hypothetical protein